LAAAGQQVLLTCFNKALAEHWKRSLALPTNVTAMHFHQLCAQAVRSAQVVPGVSGPAYLDWLPTGLLEAAVTKPEMRFDAVVVDEGQDFDGEWLETLECLLRDDNSRYVIFFDDNQRLYERANLPASFGRGFPLDRNVRNTNEIGEIVRAFYSGEMRLSGVHGEHVQVLDIESFESEHAALRATFEDLRRRGADPSDIVVLTPTALERSSLLQARRFGRWRLRTIRESAEGEVLIETIHSFKGRDQRIVVLAELDRLDELRAWKGDVVTALLYVGCSRATQLLVVLAAGSLSQQLLSLGATIVNPAASTPPAE
jgi:superfamily I DNA/RNA helicase